MGLGSSERSGTPLETRGAASAAGLSIEDLFRTGGQRGGLTRATQGIASPLQRLGTQAQQNLLATQFGEQSLRDILGGALGDPNEGLTQYSEALRPFEQETTERQVAGLRGAFGQQGGRFSENLLQAESDLRGNLADQFRRSREEFQLESGRLQAQNIASVLGALGEARRLGTRQGLGGLRQILGYAQPGPPVIEQGFLPGLLSAGANIAGFGLLSGALGGGGGGVGSVVPSPPRISPPRSPDFSGYNLPYGY